MAVTPFEDGYRLGSTMEFAGYDESLNPARLQLLRDGAAEFLQEPLGEVEQEEWYGWRPMTEDGKPLIGRLDRMTNVWIAAGHNMIGVTLAPATGKLIAELVNGEPPHVDPRPFAPRRN